MPPTTFSPMNTVDPFADMRRMQSAMNRLFDGARSPGQTGTYPPVNFWAGEDSIVMTSELPGLTEQDIDLTVQDTMLSIRVTYPAAETGDDLVWHRRERAEGSYLRTIELPFRVDPDRIDSRFENGVLAVEMQRPEDDKPKHITIKTT